MALPPLATVADLEARLGRSVTDPDEVARADAALADASTLARLEGRQDWWTAEGGLTVPAAVVTVVLTAAKREVTNPDQVISDTVGPFTRRRADGTTTGVYLTEGEKAIVRRYRATSPGLWTQPTTRRPVGDDTVWFEDTFGAELFPLGSADDGVW